MLAIAAKETYFTMTLITSGILVKSNMTFISTIRQIIAYNNPKLKAAYGLVKFS